MLKNIVKLLTKYIIKAFPKYFHFTKHVHSKSSGQVFFTDRVSFQSFVG